MFCVLFVALRRKPPSRWRLLLRSARCLWSLRSRSLQGGSRRFAFRPPCCSALVFSVSPPAPPPPCLAGRYAPRHAREGGALALRLGGRPDRPPPSPAALHVATLPAGRQASPPPPPRRRLRAKVIRGLVISFLSIYNEKRGFRPLMLCLYAAAPASLLLFALRGAVLVLSLWGRAAPYAPSVACRIARCVQGGVYRGLRPLRSCCSSRCCFYFL
jgi:hypothetical protein